MDIIEQIREDMRNGTVPDLDARLQPYLITEDIPRIQHPLVHQIFYSPMQNRMYNAMFHHKLQNFKTALRTEDWHYLLNLTERPFRIPVFSKYATRMSNLDYWTNLAWVYVDSENIDQHSNLMMSLLLSERGGRRSLMVKGEQEALDAMPNVLRVYKGFSDYYAWDTDFSFTLDLKVARWFARRFDCPYPKLLEALVSKEAVLAYFTRRNEEEILVDPKHVQVIRETRIRPTLTMRQDVAEIHQTINRVTP